jgi:hypothetical protein
MPAESDHPIQNKAKHREKKLLGHQAHEAGRNKALLALFPPAGIFAT